MKLAIITLTSGGIYYAKKLNSYYPDANIYTLKKHLEAGLHEIQPSLKQLVGELFKTHEGILFIMATGIVVRTIAPFVKHKTIDPAIMVMDEKGEFVISLLSGHIGKANDWTVEIASYLRALPVITTATDVNEKMAVDIIAEKLECAIDDMDCAKDITVRILENQNIGIYSEKPINFELKPPLFLLDGEMNEQELETKSVDGLIIISDKMPQNISLPYAWLFPKDIVVGIGCKRGKSKDALSDALHCVLNAEGIDLKRVSKFVTVDIKSDEVGLMELARSLKVPLQCIPREVIRLIEDDFEGSDFVKKTLGVKAVSEPCGYIGSGYGQCLVSLKKIDGITLSLWEKA